MPKELERYNTLRYENQPAEGTDFVDFLYENTDLTAPEVDVDDAWNDLKIKIERGKTRSNSWMRVAASVVLLIGAAIFVWDLATTAEQINIASLDKKINVTFPDGSKGVLNSNSSFSFQEKFGDERIVALEGEAYFDIKKSTKPFIIEMGDVQVNVLGTAFNLTTSENTVELVVERGLVAFGKEGEQTKIQAGLKAVFDKKTNSVAVTDTSIENVASWVDNNLEFSETTFSNVVADLSAHFDVPFQLENEAIGTCMITATFSKNSLGEILEVLQTMLDVQVVESETGVVISGKGC